MEGGEFEGGAKAVAEDGDVEGVGDLVELEDLVVGEELGFVDEDGTEFGGYGDDFWEVEPIGGEVVEVGGGEEGGSGELEAEARGDDADGVAVVFVGGEE